MAGKKSIGSVNIFEISQKPLKNNKKSGPVNVERP